MKKILYLVLCLLFVVAVIEVKLVLYVIFFYPLATLVSITFGYLAYFIISTQLKLEADAKRKTVGCHLHGKWYLKRDNSSK